MVSEGKSVSLQKPPPSSESDEVTKSLGDRNAKLTTTKRKPMAKRINERTTAFLLMEVYRRVLALVRTAIPDFQPQVGRSCLRWIPVAISITAFGFLAKTRCYELRLYLQNNHNHA